MGNIFGLHLVLLTILLSPDYLSWGEQLKREGIFARHSNEPIYRPWLSNQDNKFSLSFLQAPDAQKELQQSRLFDSFRNKEFSARLEMDTDQRFSSSNDPPENRQTFEKHLLLQRISGYRFHQIPFTETNWDPSLKIIPGLLVGQYRDEFSFKEPETSKERDLMKAFSVLLQLQFQF